MQLPRGFLAVAFSSVLVVHVAVAVLAAFLITQQAPAPPTLAELPAHLQAWHAQGTFLEVDGGHRVFVIEKSAHLKGTAPSFLLLHGFPSSTYEYHRVVEDLAARGHVVLFDFLGFGFSDKPEHFSFSLHEQAEAALFVWRSLDIREAHVVSHDMGDSVATELMARWQRQTLPARFAGNGFFKSMVFSNGGMQVELINFRVTQRALLTPVGGFLSHTLRLLDQNSYLFRQQLRSIWSPTADPAERDQDIADMIALVKFGGGDGLAHKTIGYLRDRYAFEGRWIWSLQRLAAQRPVFGVLWGDSDAVAPMAIGERIAGILGVPLHRIRDVGHFVQLEAPREWVATLLQIQATLPSPTSGAP